MRNSKKPIFLDYSKFNDVNLAFMDFTDKLMEVIDQVAPYREFRVKGHTEEWFDGDIFKRIKIGTNF